MLVLNKLYKAFLYFVAYLLSLLTSIFVGTVGTSWVFCVAEAIYYAVTKELINLVFVWFVTSIIAGIIIFILTIFKATLKLTK